MRSRMTLAVLLLTAVAMNAAVLVDRIAAIVGKHAIKASEIDRDLRVTAFLNRQPIDLGASTRRKAADRLVDQEMIRQELTVQGYPRPTDDDANRLIQQITKERYAGSTASMDAALQRYGLTRDILRRQLLWQLTVLRFIDARFRPGILVTDEEIRAYYNQHLNELSAQSPKDFSLSTLSPKIKEILEGQRINQEFESWLDQARKRHRIEYKDAAFQ